MPGVWKGVEGASSEGENIAGGRERERERSTMLCRMREEGDGFHMYLPLKV